MKKMTMMIVLAVAAAAALATVLSVAACGERSERAPSSAAEATFSVKGMHCASCPVTVRTAAKRLDGVYEARVDADQGRAWASYDPARTSPAAIAAAITDAGYASTPLANGGASRDKRAR